MQYLLIAVLMADLRRRGLVALDDGLGEEQMLSATGLPIAQLRLFMKEETYRRLGDRVCLGDQAFRIAAAASMLPPDVEPLAAKVRDYFVMRSNNRNWDDPIPYNELRSAVRTDDDALLQCVLVFFTKIGRLVESLPTPENGWHVQLSSNMEMYMKGFGRPGPCFALVEVQPKYQKILSDGAKRYASIVTGGVMTKEPWRPAPVKPSDDEILTAVFTNFARTADVLAKSTREGISTYQSRDEYDIQHLLEALLSTWYGDIRKEEWTESFAGKSTRIDLVLKDASIAVELKFIHEGMTTKKISDALIMDHERYSKHSSVKALWCLVYDPHRRLDQATSLMKDLTRGSTLDGTGVKMHVIVSPTP